MTGRDLRTLPDRPPLGSSCARGTIAYHPHSPSLAHAEHMKPAHYNRSVQEQAPPGLRADAERNRRRLLDAARATFTADGLNVSMRQIARNAGVSEPTLRRRFPSKEDLVAEAFQDKIADYADAAEAALHNDDAWVGFTGFLTRLTGMQLADRGFTDVLTMTFPASLRAEHHRRRAYRAITDLIERAQVQGSLRADFSPEDLVLVLMAHAGIVSAAGDLAGTLSPRLLSYLTQAFAAPARNALPPAPSAASTYRALLRLHPTSSTSSSE
mgnify:CR=1 FL=1